MVMRAATETLRGPRSEYPSLTPSWSQEKEPQSKNRRGISSRAKRDRRACRSNTQTLPAQPTQYRIERNASCQPPDEYAMTPTAQSAAAASIKISGSP